MSCAWLPTVLLVASELPEYAGQGRPPQYGQLVRPLPRQRKGHTIEATEPDLETCFEVDGRTIRAQSWHNLVLSELKVDPSHQTFSIWVFFDPLYTDPHKKQLGACVGS